MQFCLEEKTSKKQKFNMLAIIFVIGITIIQCVQPRLLPEKCKEFGGSCDEMPRLFNYTRLIRTMTYEATIDLHCPYKKMDLYGNCLDIWKLKCFGPVQRKVASTIFQAPPILEMCGPGSPSRSDFIEYAVCLRNIHNRYVKCDKEHYIAVDYHKHLFREQKTKLGESKSLDVRNLDFDESEVMQIMCGLFHNRVQCISDAVREFCGPSIESFSRLYEVQRYMPVMKDCFPPAPEENPQEFEIVVEMSEDPVANNYQYDFEIDNVSTGSNNEKQNVPESQ